MRINTRAAQDKRIRECFDFLYYICRKELKPDEFMTVKNLRESFYKHGSLSDEQEQCLFAMAETYKQKQQ